jgi:hypothetical protein
MLHKTPNRRINILFCSLIAVLFLSCHKSNNKEPIIFNIVATIPYDGTPIPGIKYKIVEYKNKSSIFSTAIKTEATGWEMTGETNAQGMASGSFDGVFKSNYNYSIYFDYSSMKLPLSLSDVSIIGPTFDKLNRSAPIDNVYNFRVLPYTTVKRKFTNTNCFDGNDKMRFKKIYMDESTQQSFDYENFGNYYVGCGIVGGTDTPFKTLCGRLVRQIEITKNNVTTTYIDTALFLPNVVNEDYIEY